MIDHINIIVQNIEDDSSEDRLKELTLIQDQLIDVSEEFQVLLTWEGVHPLLRYLIGKFPTGYIVYGFLLYYTLIREIFHDLEQLKPLNEPIYEGFLNQREKLLEFWMRKETDKRFTVRNLTHAEHFHGNQHFYDEINLPPSTLDKFRVPSKDCDNFTCDPGFFKTYVMSAMDLHESVNHALRITSNRLSEMPSVNRALGNSASQTRTILLA